MNAGVAWVIALISRLAVIFSTSLILNRSLGRSGRSEKKKLLGRGTNTLLPFQTTEGLLWVLRAHIQSL